MVRATLLDAPGQARLHHVPGLCYHRLPGCDVYPYCAYALGLHLHTGL